VFMAETVLAADKNFVQWPMFHLVFLHFLIVIRGSFVRAVLYRQ